MHRIRPPSLLLVVLMLMASASRAQVIPFDSNRWEISGQTAVMMDYLGESALMLQGANAVLDEAAFTDGVIEFDIAFAEIRTFTGVNWRIQEGDNYEEFYFRPHLSGKPDASQYTPVHHGTTGWQLYFGEAYSAPFRYRFNEWMHVKIAVAGGRGEVYLDSDEPILTFEHKGERVAGPLRIYASSFGPAYFANFSYRTERPTLQGTPKREADPPAGAVMQWTVSSPFEEARLDGAFHLTEADTGDLAWTMLDAERTGIANLAPLAPRSGDRNTVFARFTLTADAEKTTIVRFGYSDRVKVYLNGQLLYSGSNNYASRDYRYLGTIGLFDELALPLNAGTNDVLFAVSEDFGGWGILAQLEDQTGLTLATP